MTVYHLTIEIVYRKDYVVEAQNLGEAQTLALEQAIDQHPGADVWLDKRPANL